MLGVKKVGSSKMLGAQNVGQKHIPAPILNIGGGCPDGVPVRPVGGGGTEGLLLGGPSLTKVIQNETTEMIMRSVC